MPRVFVTGASGFVGRSLVAYLAERGHQVVGLSRSAASDANIKAACPDASVVRGDLGDVEVLAKGMQGCDWVVHCAAKVALAGKWADFESDTVKGTANVLAAAQAAEVKRFVHVGTEAVTVRGAPGSDDMSNMDETRPLKPPKWAFYSRSKALAEQAVVAANGAGGMETVVVRPRFVWGKGDTVLLPGIIQQVQSGAFKWMSPRGYKTSTCHVQNVCEGIVGAAERGRGGEVYFILDPDGPIGFETFLTTLMATRNVKPPKGSVPVWLVWVLATLLEILPFATSDRGVDINRQAIALVGHEVTATDAKARRELGYVGHVTIEQGVQELRDETVAAAAGRQAAAAS